MSSLNASLNIRTGRDYTYDCIMSDQYTEIVTSKQKVDNADAFNTLATFGSSTVGIATAAGIRMKGAKLIVIKNNSPVGVELQFRVRDWLDSSNIDQTNSVDLGPGSATTIRSISYLLGANEYMVLPSSYMCSYAEDASAGNAKTIDNKAGYDVDNNLYVAASDVLLDEGSNITDSVTNFTVDDGDMFRVGDLIRIDNEIMEVTSITTNELYVRRAVNSSTAAAHNDDAPIRFPFFNAYQDFDKYTYSQTDSNGKFKSMNLFGYGRSKTYPTGIVKGSFAMKLYSPGYQDCGLTGITSSTNSGLTASTTYYFKIAVDGGSAYEVAFTTDASNLNFGGANGIVNKIQTILDAQFYTEGNLFERGVNVSIVDGDLRFTSKNRTRASAIALTAGTSGTANTDELFDGSNQIARFPASPKSAVEAQLPDDLVYSKETYVSSKNQGVFAYDDGKGNILGAVNGTINYETGSIDFTGPPNAEFAVSFNYDSAHSGGINANTDQQNTLTQIGARSCNSKIDAEVEVIGFI